MDSPLEDVEFLSRSAHRVGVLTALADGPLERADLRAQTGASTPTIGRILHDFERRGWVVRDGHEFTLTQPGSFVARNFTGLLERLEIERNFRDVWELLPGELDGFSLDLVADAVITTVEPGDPHAPANRCASFYPTTDRVRGFDAAVTAPHNFETLAELVSEGLDAEFVVPQAIAEKLRASYPESDDRMNASGNFTTWWSDSLPMARLIIFDDRVGVGGYDTDSGVLAVYVDSDDRELRRWAISTYERVRREASPPRTDRTTG